MRLAGTLPILAVVIAWVFVAPLVRAESVLWSKTTKSLTYNYGGNAHFFGSKAQLSVQYAIRVINADTGEILSSGASVPEGTNVRFQFIPQRWEDISWFITGYADDSPYGRWTENAAPPSDLCWAHDSNVVGQYGGKDVTCVIGGCARPAIIIATMSYAVHPPAKHLEGTENFSCTSEGVDKNCSLTTPGAYTVRFIFSETPGNLWSANQSYANCPAVLPAGYQNPSLPVPQQTIPFTLNVTAPDHPEDPPEMHTPTTPTLTSGGACVVGTPHSIGFVSFDPDNDNVKYGLDWDADGSVDQWIPPTGYVASGESQSAARTYSLAGSKTVKVMAQDEGGLSSEWATLSFSCTETPQQPPASQCSDTTDNDGDGLIDSLDPDCSATAGLSEFPASQQPPATPGPVPSLDAVLDLRVIPSLVKSGNTTKVSWSAQNVESCSVTAQNGDAWTGISSPVGGNISKPITAQTVYTLSCIDLNGATQTKTATVRVLPTWQEK